MAWESLRAMRHGGSGSGRAGTAEPAPGRQDGEANGVGTPAAGGESPVADGVLHGGCIPSRAGHEISRLKQGGPPSKAKDNPATDSAQYREGTVKRTAGAE